MTPDLIQTTGTYPLVVGYFKIIIDFVWNIISYPIDLGGMSISIFGIIVFCFLAVTLLKMLQLKVPSFKGGSDSYGKFSSPTSHKKGK